MRRLFTLLALCFASSTANATVVTIDNFEDGGFTIVAPTGPTTSSETSLTGVLGGNRDGEVVRLSGSNTVEANTTAVAGVAVAGSGILTAGTYESVYGRGVAAPFDLTLDYLTTSSTLLIGQEWTSFLTFDNVFIGLANALNSVTITVLDTSARSSSTTVAVSTFGTQLTDTFDLWTENGAGQTDFESVDEIQFLFNVNGTFGTDNFNVTTTLPEPTSLALLCGLAGVALVVRRRKR